MHPWPSCQLDNIDRALHSSILVFFWEFLKKMLVLGERFPQAGKSEIINSTEGNAVLKLGLTPRMHSMPIGTKCSLGKST